MYRKLAKDAAGIGLSSRPTGRLEDEACVSVVGGPWRFLRCEILAVPTLDGVRMGGRSGGAWGGVAVHTAGLGDCYLRSCTLGGRSGRRRCGEAVVVGEDSEVRMKKCMLQEARFALVRVVECGLLDAADCMLRAASYAIGLAGDGRACLRGCGEKKGQGRRGEEGEGEFGEE